MEVWVIALGLAAALIALGVRATLRSFAAEDAERAMRYGDVAHMRAILAVRGHLLRKSVRDAANVWLAEKEGS